MTVREILRLALRGSIRFDLPPPDTETYTQAGPAPSPEHLADLRLRARNGQAAAQRELGLLAYRGRGMTEDRAEAFMWLTLASRQGDPAAERALEYIGPTLSLEQAYEGRRRLSELTGEPLPPPPPPADAPEPARPDAERLYEQALQAMREQGLIEREGLPAPAAQPLAPEAVESVPRVPPPARPLVWALSALALVVVVAGVGAVLYHLGGDERKAGGIPARGGYSVQSSAAGGTYLARVGGDVAALRAAAEAGHARAQFEMGLACATGSGVPRDPAAAAEWYRKAALQREIAAMNNLGVLYIQGTGVPQDFVQAYVWLHLAAQGGSAGSRTNRDQLALYMSAAQIAEAMRQAAAIRQQWAASAAR